MSRNLRIFLGVAFWIPFSWFLWSFFKGYSHGQLLQNMEICSREMGVHLAEANDKKNAASFVMCLKGRTHALSWWYLDPERLYQIVQPHTPCQWVGRWQVKRGETLIFAIELNAYGRYQIDSSTLQSTLAQDESSYQGVWSSPALNRILWFTDGRIWPIDDNKVEWLNSDQLVIHELDDVQTYYQRMSSRIPNCPTYP